MDQAPHFINWSAQMAGMVLAAVTQAVYSGDILRHNEHIKLSGAKNKTCEKVPITSHCALLNKHWQQSCLLQQGSLRKPAVPEEMT